VRDDEVNAAFRVILERLAAATDDLNEAAAGAARAGDYDKAKAAIEEAARLAGFRERVEALREEWTDLFPPRTQSEVRGTDHKARSRLRRGARTPEDAFRRPILETLVELGGSAPADHVLDRVGQKLRHVLNDYDRQRLVSHPHEPRWRNTARLCRQRLVLEGLMSDDSPRGVWEISERGREWLREHPEEREAD